MHGLPEDLIVEIVDDFVAEQKDPTGHSSLPRLAVASYGKNSPNYSDAVHAQVPLDRSAKHEHGLAWSANVPP